jgi:hypothetical protein
VTVQQATEAIGIVVGFGLALSPLVFAAVALLRGMIASKRQRRVVLPIAGTLIGWLMAALVLAVLEVAFSLKTTALVLLAGFWGFATAAGLNAQQRQSGREDERG